MPTDHRAVLASIRTFSQLIAYLRDEMGWPIARDSFEDVDDLFFDFTAEELGIDPKTAAKIEEIKRLRPLVPQQPWGVFFVKFEPKKLPVVALRRILNQVALKKRASANSDERAAWRVDDLLFVSNYGEGDERQITFAHFSQEEDGLPTLKVLGWDNLDTPLHLDDVAEYLTRDLAWPEDERDVERWREKWSSAFVLRSREVITTSRELSIRLAKLARAIRDRINTTLAIETETGPLTKLMTAFREALVHDLEPDDFADMYAQTIAYGLLSARIANPKASTGDHRSTHQILITNPFLKELMETFLHVGEGHGKSGAADIDFDELGVSEVVELLDDAKMEAVVVDFGDKNPQEDPVIHFYELFLKEYDAKKRMQRGVFYTPRPVVSYIVRSVDELLRTEFGLEDGLADTTTWGEMAERHKDLEIPEGTSPDQAFVQILDPATGTGTFLVEVIDLIHRTLVEKWGKEAGGPLFADVQERWNDYVPKHLLPRLHGYELLMAPYAIAHLKIGLKLYETGYRFGSDERARIYLTNALEPAHDFSGRFEFAIPALAHEAQAVNEIKRKQRFTVVIGNPPYAGISSNMTSWIHGETNTYLQLDGVRIEEKSKRNHLQNDYIKFIRFADILCERSKSSLFCFVTSNSYLDGRTLRGLRWNLLQRFYRLRIVNLFGDSKKRDAAAGDKNVFDITEGVSIILAARGVTHSFRSVSYAEIQGPRQHKYEELLRTSSSIVPSDIEPTSPHYLFKKADASVSDEFSALGPTLADLYAVSGAGMKTNRDDFATDENTVALLDRMVAFADRSIAHEEIRSRYSLKDNYVWKLPKARADFMTRPVTEDKIVPLQYRPFDRRYVYYDKAVVFNPRFQVMTHMIDGSNLALVSIGQNESKVFNHAFVSRVPVEIKMATHYGASIVFPTILVEQESVLIGAGERGNSNFTAVAHDLLQIATSRPSEVHPELPVVYYIYAILYSRSYRIRYAEPLMMDFPRIPTRLAPDLFKELAGLGGQLVALHLMESPKLDHFITTYIGPKNSEVGRIGWSDETVWLDAAATKKGQPAKPGTIGFRGVPEAVWNFHIGGYQVCHKWLKDRKGRTLSDDDIAHYQKIVVALSETIRIMKEIDEVIEAHGGWPDAFATSEAEEAT